MRFETKMVKIGSRSALVGGGERDRLLDDRRTPEIGWLISHNRPGLASASPKFLAETRGWPAHDDSKTQQLRRFSGQAGSRRPCANVLAFQTLAGQHLCDHDCRCGLASCGGSR